MRKNTLHALAATAAVVSMAACSSIDCPMSSHTYASFKLAGDMATLSDTLTVSTPRVPDTPDEDTVLINRLTATDSLSLPMSYARTEDIYYFTIIERGTEKKTTDTVWVTKDNEPHFESVDCAPAMFHNISAVRFTQHAIDDIQINNNKVTYNDAKAHFLIYFKSSND